MRTLEEYIAYYERHSGEKFSPHPGCKLFFLPERGFCELKITKGLIVYYQLAGDAKFWRDFGEVLAGLVGAKALGTICTRAIKPYIRWWGYDVEREEKLPGGGVIYYARNKRNGRGARCAPAWSGGGKTAYFVTEYLEGDAL